MSLKEQTLAVIDALNRHDFDTLLPMFEEEAVLDLPDGIRVIGHASFRDTLAAYVLRHGITLSDHVVMADAAGFRVAVECTLNGSDRRDADGGVGGDEGPYALPAVLVLERDSDLFLRLSLYAGTRP
ncbi:SnoaL-like domain-containing protein [Rhizobium sp. RU33A]|uniref:YybH family protein n=1 Tax=Rhizobium sp. RU33A TaxID=1907413 RepID=UPI000956CF35|nr:nuclear transport factor 2 family protein [Rhizobium sp. RU33A]SIQ35970.1 SnoaL-like domain-containing protein [Rhizobium sp. RU33A]